MLWGFENTRLHTLPCHHVIITPHPMSALCYCIVFHIILNHIAQALGRSDRSVVKII